MTLWLWAHPVAMLGLWAVSVLMFAGGVACGAWWYVNDDDDMEATK